MALSATGMRERMAQALKDKRKFLSGEAEKKQTSERGIAQTVQAGATKRTGLQEAGQALRQGRGFEQAEKTAGTSRQQSLTDMARQREQTLADTTSKRGFQQETAGRKAGLDIYTGGGTPADAASAARSGQTGIDFSKMSRITQQGSLQRVGAKYDKKGGITRLGGSYDPSSGVTTYSPQEGYDPKTGMKLEEEKKGWF